jgi:hypothetical protein
MIGGVGSTIATGLAKISETGVDEIFTEIVLTGPERAL